MIYELRNPISDMPFYIGWTDTAVKGSRRPVEHLQEEARAEGKITKGNRLKLNTIRKIKNAGQQVVITELFWSDDFEYSQSIEKYYIALWGRRDLGTGCLTNMTDGGEGTVGRKDSEETIRKKAAGRTGVKASERTRELIRNARLNQPSYVRDEEFRKKLSERSWFRTHATESFDEKYGIEKSENIRKKQSTSRKEYLRKNPMADTSRKEGHKIMWIKKMAATYTSIFALLDEGKRQFEIVQLTGSSRDTVRKAISDRVEITQLLEQYASQ
jgi:hypothetical protein